MKNIKTQTVKSVIPIAKGNEESVVKQDEKKQWNIIDWKAKRVKNLKPWKKWQSGNLKWRPLKWYSYIIAMLKKKGFEKITKQEYSDMEWLMLALPRKEMLLIGNDEELPMAWRIKAKEMLSDRGADQVETIADRLFGKPKQAIEQSWEVNLTLAAGLLALRNVKQKDEV